VLLLIILKNMTTPDTPTTHSSRQFNFEHLAAQTQPLNGNNLMHPQLFIYQKIDMLTVDDMMAGSKKNTESWGAPSYRVPPTCFFPKKGEGKETDKKPGNVAEGPAFSVGKSQRGRFYHLNNYGKDGKEPPHSYLQVTIFLRKTAKR
jgi:hypothetical protein